MPNTYEKVYELQAVVDAKVDMALRETMMAHEGPARNIQKCRNILAAHAKHSRNLQKLLLFVQDWNLQRQA